MTDNTITSKDFPKVYNELGYDTSKLGSVMYTLAPLTVTSLVEGGENDLFFSESSENPYAQGAVAETEAHVTLLYGLLDSGTAWKPYVDAVLEGWTLPSVRISSVGFFPSHSEGEDYSTIIAHLDLTPELIEGHQRLQLLPHISTFLEYRPHLTLAYVKNGPSGVDWVDSVKDKWVQTLGESYSGKELVTLDIKYGGVKHV